MDMQSRNQYLKELRREYLKNKLRKKKSELLDEAQKRTGLDRKYLVKKLKPKSNLDKRKEERKKRKKYYDGYVEAALVRCWEIFDRPCGQRLKPLLCDEVERLRRDQELICSDDIALKLKKISFRSIDKKLIHEKETLLFNQKYARKNNPLLYQKIPVKLSHEWDRNILGNIQNDYVEHCGQSTAGEYVNSLANTDVATGWWECEAIMGQGQYRTRGAIENVRKRFPFDWKEIHPDNGKGFINVHLYNYTQEENLGFSRSRPNKKNDNCFVEQKNWTHIRKFTGYRRYDTKKEQDILNDLYRNELRLYKNFFQPVMKLVSKERLKGKIKRKYDEAKTPYKRVMESCKVLQETKVELKKIYDSLNPAELKREIERKKLLLYDAYEEKKQIKWQPLKVEVKYKKLKPSIVSNYVARPKAVRCHS